MLFFTKPLRLRYSEKQKTSDEISQNTACKDKPLNVSELITKEHDVCNNQCITSP